MAAFSFMTFLLMIPTFIWHCVSRNIPAIFLIFWLAYSNLTSFINILIWGRGDSDNVWDGKGYCDVVVKLKEGGSPGKIAAAAALAMNLYFILRAKPLPLLQHNSRRKATIELSMCIITPIFVMCVSYAVQQLRYEIAHYVGCRPSLRYNVASIFLYTIWPFLWAIVAIVFTLLALAKFLQQRKELSNILLCTDSGLNMRRFARLLLFVSVVIVALAPITIYQFAANVHTVVTGHHAHTADLRDKIYFADMSLSEMYGQYVDIGLSVLAFIVFGTGSEAVAMYTRFAKRLVPGIMWHRLKRDSAPTENKQRSSLDSMKYPSRFDSNAETAYSKTNYDIDMQNMKAFEKGGIDVRQFTREDLDEVQYSPHEAMYHSKTYIVKEGV